MSYEILLYPRTPGQDWAEVLAADEQDGPTLDQAALNRGVARFRRIEARLREDLGEPVRTWVAEELDGDILGEFQTRDSRLRVDLYDRSASVSAPYVGPGSAVHDLIRHAVEIVAAETGYEAYDPQVQDTFDGTFDDAAGQASASRLTDQDDLWAGDASASGPEEFTGHGEAQALDAAAVAPLEGRVLDDEAVDEDQAAPLDPRAERARLIQERREERRQQIEAQRRDPAALRRRGWIYLVLGGFLTAFAVMRISAGVTDVLTWMFLIVGVFEMVGARLMFSQSRRFAQEQQAQASSGGEEPSSDRDQPSSE